MSDNPYERLRRTLAAGVDRNRLDEQLEEHNVLVLEITEHLGFAADAADEAAQAVKIATAIAGEKLRESGDENGKSFSEARITTLVNIDEDVVDAKAEEAKAIGAKRRWDALYASSIARGSTLKRLAELTVSGYLAPNSGGSGRPADRAAEQGREGMAAARRRRLEGS